MKRINLQEQFIMAYGGLRGGVGFSLLKMIDSKVIPAADIFVTTGLMVVMATVWIQGIITYNLAPNLYEKHKLK